MCEKLEVGKVYKWSVNSVLMLYVSPSGNKGLGLVLDNINQEENNFGYTFVAKEVTLSDDQTHPIRIDIKPIVPFPKIAQIWKKHSDYFLLTAFSPEINSFLGINTLTFSALWIAIDDFELMEYFPDKSHTFELS